MKVLQQIAFLMLVSFVCPSVNAGRQHFNSPSKHTAKHSDGHKKPDQRQQKQQARKAAEHLTKISTPTTARYERWHPVRSQVTDISTRQKMLALFLVAMIANAEIIHVISVAQQAPKNSKSPNSKSHSKSPIKNPEKSAADLPIVTEATPISESSSAIYLKPYVTGQELETFGPCETLEHNSKFCCDIQPEYVVECCVHPNTTGFSRCGAFAPWGIINGQSQTHPFNVTAAFFEAKKMYAERTGTHRVASETFDLLRQMSPRYLQNLNGTRCTIETFLPEGDSYDMSLRRKWDDGSIVSCPIRITDISQTNILPTLTAMINGLARKFNLPNVPKIFIYSDGACDPFVRQGIAILSGIVTGPDGLTEKIQGVGLSYTSLVGNSDEQLADTFGHEIHHLKQPDNNITCTKTGNNREAEADIASVLVRWNPFLSVWLSKKYDGSIPTPTITQENMYSVLAVKAYFDYIYPSHQGRRALMMPMDFFHKILRDLLLRTTK